MNQLSEDRGSSPREDGDRARHILLVEDNPGDARLISELINGGAVRHVIHHVEDGTRAMEYLRREGEFSDGPRPNLIILDLNLPKKDGREVLAEVKTDPELRMTPVVVLTTSGAEQDLIRTYGLHANCFVTKPVDFDDFQKVMEAIERFWFHVVCLPPVAAG